MMPRLECRKHKGDMHVLARVGNIKEKTREQVDVLVRWETREEVDVLVAPNTRVGSVCQFVTPAQ